ncbi:hypothetical protein MPER_13248 [Moniliophthora perniciosa FA553]|nr:hypothetical protein MPER_13248 [Moniliophthora perniciosa FA553]
MFREVVDNPPIHTWTRGLVFDLYRRHLDPSIIPFLARLLSVLLHRGKLFPLNQNLHIQDRIIEYRNAAESGSESDGELDEDKVDESEDESEHEAKSYVSKRRRTRQTVIGSDDDEEEVTGNDKRGSARGVQSNRGVRQHSETTHTVKVVTAASPSKNGMKERITNDAEKSLSEVEEYEMTDKKLQEAVSIYEQSLPTNAGIVNRRTLAYRASEYAKVRVGSVNGRKPCETCITKKKNCVLQGGKKKWICTTCSVDKKGGCDHLLRLKAFVIHTRADIPMSNAEDVIAKYAELQHIRRVPLSATPDIARTNAEEAQKIEARYKRYLASSDPVKNATQEIMEVLDLTAQENDEDDDEKKKEEDAELNRRRSGNSHETGKPGQSSSMVKSREGGRKHVDKDAKRLKQAAGETLTARTRLSNGIVIQAPSRLSSRSQPCAAVPSVLNASASRRKEDRVKSTTNGKLKGKQKSEDTVEARYTFSPPRQSYEITTPSALADRETIKFVDAAKRPSAINLNSLTVDVLPTNTHLHGIVEASTSTKQTHTTEPLPTTTDLGKGMDEDLAMTLCSGSTEKALAIRASPTDTGRERIIEIDENSDALKKTVNTSSSSSFGGEIVNSGDDEVQAENNLHAKTDHVVEPTAHQTNLTQSTGKTANSIAGEMLRVVEIMQDIAKCLPPDLTKDISRVDEILQTLCQVKADIEKAKEIEDLEVNFMRANLTRACDAALKYHNRDAEHFLDFQNNDLSELCKVSLHAVHSLESRKTEEAKIVVPLLKNICERSMELKQTAEVFGLAMRIASDQPGIEQRARDKVYFDMFARSDVNRDSAWTVATGLRPEWHSQHLFGKPEFRDETNTFLTR